VATGIADERDRSRRRKRPGTTIGGLQTNSWWDVAIQLAIVPESNVRVPRIDAADTSSPSRNAGAPHTAGSDRRTRVRIDQQHRVTGGGARRRAMAHTFDPRRVEPTPTPRLGGGIVAPRVRERERARRRKDTDPAVHRANLVGEEGTRQAFPSAPDSRGHGPDAFQEEIHPAANPSQSRRRSDSRAERPLRALSHFVGAIEQVGPKYPRAPFGTSGNLPRGKKRM